MTGPNPVESAVAAPAGRGDAEAAAPQPDSKLSLWGILKAGGTVGFVIILLSLATVALAIEQALTLRKSVLLPESLAAQVRSALAARDGKQAVELCRQQPCLLSHVLLAGMAELEAGWSEVEKAVEDALAEQSARLLRKVEYLSVIGNLAPMLGLLGTVVGMILAFRTVAETQGAARAADLAEAIYLALVTTVEGLIVAIPALALYAYFRNRTDELTAEAASVAQRTLLPLKRRRSPAKPPAAPLPEGGR
ncbi:MAG: MotA/TolQ/ExbB proton channel family protein [Thermogutta sp.]|nr:MotA/TolQ/ExbB proton channel family protein [Thermogutta sp.]